MLLDDPNHFWETRGISSLAQEDWIIRASVLRNDLSSKERDLLEKRLLINMAKMRSEKYRQLEEALRVTQLLDVIGRPIDRDRYRPQIHDMLREFHSKQPARGFEPAGGFKAYLNSNAGSLDATAYAVELMEIYGIPDDLDIHSVRSNLQRPKHYDHDFIAAVTLDRVNRLPGMQAAPRPTWLEYLYYTRTLIMAVLLVLLCIYATLSSPLSPRSSNVS